MRHFLPCLALLACTPDDPGTVPTPDGEVPVDADLPEACGSTGQVLEIVPLDIWGQDLDADSALDRTATVLDASALGPGVVRVPLGDDPVDLVLVVAADDHEPVQAHLTWLGGGGRGSLQAETPAPARHLTAWRKADVDEVPCEVHTVVVGLDHSWFAAAGRRPSLNEALFLPEGELYWGTAFDRISEATDRVTVATWWWESDFELVRPPDGDWDVDPAVRWERTMGGLLESLVGVDRRVLVNRFWGENFDLSVLLNTDATLRDAMDTPGDGMEVLLQGNSTVVDPYLDYAPVPLTWSFAARVLDNPRYGALDLVDSGTPGGQRGTGFAVDAASWHQKVAIVDGDEAFVGGFNIKGTDWDTADHLVFDPYRMTFDADEDARIDVADGQALPDFGPRRDMGAWVHGPAAHDVEDILRLRWELGRATGVVGSEVSTPMPELPRPEPVADGVWVQVQATMPSSLPERSILESHAKAMAQAEDLIIIEDQYFRAPLVLDVIVERMLSEPDLQLLVVTKETATLDPGAKYTWLGDRQLADLFGDRYQLLVLRAFDVFTEQGVFWDNVEVHDVPMDTHTKLRIVDDRFFSVGSCNFNNRGYLYEGELNLSVLDRDFARDARDRVLAQWVGPDFADQLTGDARHDAGVVRAAATHNAAVVRWWENHGDDLSASEAETAKADQWPSGFVHPLAFDGYFWDVSADAF